MSKRISVTKKELKKVQKTLKRDKNMTLDDISRRIDADFGNHLYKDFNMAPEAFNKLQNLYEQEIAHEVVDHKNGVSYDKRVAEIEKKHRTSRICGYLAR